MKIDYFGLILKILMVFGLILVIYWFIQILIGESPTITQLNSGIILKIKFDYLENFIKKKK